MYFRSVLKQDTETGRSKFQSVEVNFKNRNRAYDREREREREVAK